MVTGRATSEVGSEGSWSNSGGHTNPLTSLLIFLCPPEDLSLQFQGLPFPPLSQSGQSLRGGTSL